MEIEAENSCQRVKTDWVENRAEFGMDADPIAANVALIATTIMFPTDRLKPFAWKKKIHSMYLITVTNVQKLIFTKREINEKN